MCLITTGATAGIGERKAAITDELTVTHGEGKKIDVTDDLTNANAVVYLAPGAKRAVVHTVCTLRPGDDEMQLELLIGILQLYPSLTKVGDCLSAMDW